MKKYIEPKNREIDLETEGMLAVSPTDKDPDSTLPENPEVEITPKPSSIWRNNEDWLNK